MAFASILGGLVGAGGQIAAGVMGGSTGGQGKDYGYNPALDYALQVAQFDGLGYTGFGDINSVPSPMQKFIGQLQSMSLNKDTRAAAIKALTVIGNHPELLDDPSGRNFTSEQLRNFYRDPSSVPSGRRITDAGNTQKFGIDPSRLSRSNAERPLPISGLGSLKQVLKQRGMGVQDIRGLLEQERQYQEDVQKLKDAGLGRLQTGTILNRAEAAKAASTLLGDAGRFATGGDPSEFQSGLMDRLQRNISDQEEALMLRAQFGGFNPSAGLEGIQRMREDSDMTALTQAVQMAGALTAGLSGGSQATQSAAGLGTQTSLGALGIAANQAAAANALRQQAAQASGESWANGIAGASNMISQQALLSQVMSQKPAMKTPQFSFYGGPGSSANQYATQNANYGGWNPSVQF